MLKLSATGRGCMGQVAAAERIYTNLIFDSSRWASFTPRDGDVVVCTSYKAGTTWTQMICLLIVHQVAKLPKALGVMSPWLDMQLQPVEEIVPELEAQPHPPSIKTHTPLHAL